MSSVIELQGKTGIYVVTNIELDTYERMFPNINVAQCFCSMRVWLDGNDGTNGTRDRRPKNMKRFIANWLIGDTRKFDIQWQSTHREAQVGR